MDYLWGTLWWLLGILWSVTLWVLVHVINYLLAPVFFIAGWMVFIGVGYYFWLVWKHGGIRAATAVYVTRVRAALRYLWTMGRKMYLFMKGVHGVQLDGAASVKEVERVVEVAKPRSRWYRWPRTARHSLSATVSVPTSRRPISWG